MMKTRTFAATLALAVASTAIPAPAFAQSDEATTKAARSRFQEGVEFYDKGQFENARASFLQAYALRKHPAVLLNLAQSSLRSNHPLEAARYFQQFLREAQGITVAQRETANTGLADARARLGRIEVVAPNGTEITMDGERVGTTPISEPLDVDAGAHMVKGRFPDGREDTVSVSVSVGQRGTAKLGAAATPPVVAPIPVTPSPTPTPAPAPATTAPPPAPAVTPQGAAPVEPPPEADSTKPGFFSPPKSMAPVWIGVGLVGVGVATAIVFGVVIKGTAQQNADSVAQTIRDNDGGPGTCTSTDPATVAKFGRACNALADNRSTVDTDALIGNVGIAVAAVGAVTAIGWYFFAPKQDSAPQAGLRTITPAPILSRDTTGLSLSGSF